MDITYIIDICEDLYGTGDPLGKRFFIKGSTGNILIESIFIDYDDLVSLIAEYLKDLKVGGGING